MLHSGRAYEAFRLFWQVSPMIDHFKHSDFSMLSNYADTLYPDAAVALLRPAIPVEEVAAVPSTLYRHFARKDDGPEGKSGWEFARSFERLFHCRQRQDKRKGLIQQRHRPVTRVPLGHSFVFRVNEHYKAADLRCRQHATASRRQQKLTSQAVPLKSLVYSQARQPESGNIVSSKAASHDFRRPAINDRSGTQAVKSEDRFAVAFRPAQEGFHPAALVILPRITPQILVKLGIAAVEGVPVVLSADGLLAPRR
jgi:hypothetical protein